ncbi:hypothetical protein [Rhodococcus sp. ACS1]|uniref:hypothetical protein n=1 Tax=Rhodococcus sp. ACS1 TaxID=2028570 RepID=UPI00117AC497|nr:hypothetical protein [Rhodococcus sp. ACS1]
MTTTSPVLATSDAARHHRVATLTGHLGHSTADPTTTRGYSHQRPLRLVTVTLPSNRDDPNLLRPRRMNSRALGDAFGTTAVGHFDIAQAPISGEGGRHHAPTR